MTSQLHLQQVTGVILSEPIREQNKPAGTDSPDRQEVNLCLDQITLQSGFVTAPPCEQPAGEGLQSAFRYITSRQAGQSVYTNYRHLDPSLRANS